MGTTAGVTTFLANRGAVPTVRAGGFTIEFSLDEFTGQLDEAAMQQLPYALALALNRTTEEAQEAVRNRIRMRGFTIRSAQSDAWLTKRVMFYRQDRASKDHLWTALQVDAPNASGGGKLAGSRSLLGFLEEGGSRTSQRPIGDGTVFPNAVVVPVRSGPMDSVPRGLYPVNLGLSAKREISGKLALGRLRGKQHTFVVRTSTGAGLVLQRQGSGESGVRALFFIKPQTRVTGRHFFYPTVQTTVEQRLGANFAGMFNAAMETSQ